MRFPALRPSALLVLAVSLSVAACDGGFDDEEARQRCDEERDLRGGESGCVTEEVYAQCLAAYDECGTDVLVAETCPTQFTCPSS